MKKYTVKDFLDGKVSIRCKNNKQKKAVLKVCKENGIDWIDGKPIDLFDFIPPSPVLTIGFFGDGRLSHGDGNHHGINVVDFYDIDISYAPCYQITIDCDGNTTTAKMLVNGKEVKTTTAKRSPADKANWRIGAQTAFDRLWKRQEKPEKEKKYGGFKVGDRVVEKFGNLHGRVVCFGKGIDEEDIVGVELYNELPSGHKCMALSLDSKPHAKDRHGLWFCPDGLCHEQPTKPEVREVKRKAKAGEYIKFIKPYGGIVKPGDIVKVNFVYESGSLTVRERDLPHKSGCEVDEHFNWYVPLCAYVVLEGYKPGRDA